MLIHIAKKEILEHIRSFRFLAAFLFIIITFFLMLFTRHFGYQTKYEDYLLRIKAQETAIDKYANFNRINWLARPITPPSQMEIIVDPAFTTTGDTSDPSRSLDENPFNATHIDFDIIALIGLLGSLLALILSYDSVNREAREGTLRLLQSSGVPRIKIILGKILGGAIAALLPIAVIFGFISIWLAITGGLGWGVNQWVSLLLIFLVSIIYVVLFYCLGVFLSSIILDQTLSALSCFGIWILFVLVIPLAGPHIAKSSIKIPDPSQIRRQVEYLYNVERDNEFRRLVLPLMAQGLTQQEAIEKTNFDEINRGYNKRANALIDNYRIAATRQTMAAALLACVSPYSMYLFAVEELSGAGLQQFQYLSNVVSNWSQKFSEFARNKFDEAVRLNPAHQYTDKLDISGAPRFQYIEPSLSAKFSNAILFILPLLGYFLLPLLLFLFTFNSKRTLL